MHFPEITLALKPSSSLLTLTNPKSDYTCYFAECWAPNCPTHGTMHQTPAIPHTDGAWSQQLSCAEFLEQSRIRIDVCLSPPSGQLIHSATAPDGIFRCYAPTCEAISCPSHRPLALPISPPHTYNFSSYGSTRPVHPTALTIPTRPRYDCPELAEDCSPSSVSSTDSYLHTPTAMESTLPVYPTPITVIVPDSEEEDWSSRSSIDSLSTFPCPPSILVEPPSARSSVQSTWTMRGDETDGYDGCSEMEGIPRRRQALGPPRTLNTPSGTAVHRPKGKENVRPDGVLRHKQTRRELRRGGRVATREMFA